MNYHFLSEIYFVSIQWESERILDNDVNLRDRNGIKGGNNDGKNDKVKVFDEMSSSRFIKHDGSVRDYYDAFVPFASKVGWNGLYGVSMFILGLEPEIARMWKWNIKQKREIRNDIEDEEIESNVLTDITNVGIGGGDLCKEDGKVEVDSANKLDEDQPLVEKYRGKKNGSGSDAIEVNVFSGMVVAETWKGVETDDNRGYKEECINLGIASGVNGTSCRDGNFVG
nr:hypothetical protein [Tanacetum cinerariifolium]